MLEFLISSQTRVKLLTLFLLNPGKEFYIREMTRRTGENINAVRRELANLEEFGLISRMKRGNQLYFTVDSQFFLFEDLQKLVMKSEGVVDLMKQRLVPLGNIECMFIYGSFASGRVKASSDIDLFIVGDIDESQVLSVVHESERTLDREINYTLMRKEEWRQRIERNDPFIMHIMKEPRIVVLDRCE